MADAPTGIRLIRQVIGELLPPGWSVATAQLDYVHDHDVEWQVITFRVIDPQGKQLELKSDKVPARDDVNELARKAARKFAEGIKNEPPDVVDPKNG